MGVLRDNRHSVMAMLEAFVYDPLINWRLLVAPELEEVRHPWAPPRSIAPGNRPAVPPRGAAPQYRPLAQPRSIAPLGTAA